MTRIEQFCIYFLLILLLVGCSVSQDKREPTKTLVPTPEGDVVAIPTPVYAGTNRRVDDDSRLPAIRNMLRRDAIRPIYDPSFAPPHETDIDPDELVLGVAWGDEAKAYSISVLRGREMVNDELAGIPILVTW